MYAYDYNLFPKAQLSLASMFDYAVDLCEIPLDLFYTKFINSSYSEKFEHGDTKVVAGMSGIELAREIMYVSGMENRLMEPVYPIPVSNEFWLGWSLAHYQWVNALPFAKITENVPIRVIYDMYSKYHEMDIRQFDDALDEIRHRNEESSLKRLRTYAGYSQSELAEITGIPLRTIQQYEQRSKDICKANVDYCIRLSKALHCDIEMLLER